MRLVSKGIYWLFMSAVLALGLLLMVSLVPMFGIKVKVVKSGSMEPAIHTGAIVVDIPRSTYQVGDVITFGADTKTQIPTTHRIVKAEGQGASETFTTQGDANDAPDPMATPLSAVHGKVFFTMPYVGYILDFARKPVGFALLVGLPALVIIVEEILKIVQEIAAIRRRKFTHATAHYPQRKKIIVD